MVLWGVISITIVICLTFDLIRTKTKLELKSMELNNAYRQINLNDSLYRTLKTQLSVNDNIKEAVKYAMTKAHPDNGGKEEDFIKFSKVYKSIK